MPFFLAVSVGLGAVVSRHVGAGNTKIAEHNAKQAMIIVTILGGVLGFVNILFAGQILGFLGAEKAVLQYAIPYYRIVVGPVFLIGATYALSSTLRAAGDTKSPMKAAAISNIVNIILDYVLIFGILGIPGMGIIGAAIATTISRIVHLIVLVRVLGGYKSPLHINFKLNWYIDKPTIWTLLKVGIPASVEKLIMRSGQLVYGGMIISIGTSAYVAHNIAGTIESFSYLPGMGFGVAASTLVGQSLGANSKKRSFSSW